MEFQFTEEEERFRGGVIEFLKTALTPEVRAEVRQGTGNIGPAILEFWRKHGAAGYRGLFWPKELGGQGSFMKELIMHDEMSYRGGPTIQPEWVEVIAIRDFTEDQKKRFLPGFLKGEINFSYGYTEPEAGVDFTGTSMKAVKDGDDYILNGQKMFSTGAHYADYQLSAAVTDPHAPKEEGLSFFAVDLKSPGITVRPLWLINNQRSNEVFYDDVRVPEENLVGGVPNRGWRQWSTAPPLYFYATTGMLRALKEVMVKYAKETLCEGKPIAKKSLFRQKLAELDLECEIARLWGYRLAWMEDKGMCPNYEYAMCKLHRDRIMQSAPVLFMQMAGLNGQFEPDSKYAVLGGAVISIYETMTRMTSLGGTREIMKNMVALRALGLPHGQGSATPYHDPKLSGSVEGASAWTTS